ncbi:MAG: radical SAM protein, partial [Desulfobacterales bacterium]|nr:radical SAM protein [Desulfobacterales bacterium]
GEATIKLADDPELLQAAAQSGCKGLLIGIETPSAAALKDSGKGFVSPGEIKEKIARFHAHGIRITSSMIFGFDTHTPEIFRESEDFCRYIGIDEVESVILIPFPGTPLYRRLDEENRLLTKDWSLYDGDNVVFAPKEMTADELKQGSHGFWQEIRKKKPVPEISGAPETQPPSGKTPGPSGGAYRGPVTTTGGKPVRWKSVLALFGIGVGLWYEWYWIWGALLVAWAITDLRHRRTYLLEDIPASESPVLYWIVVLMWLFLGLWSLFTSPALSGFLRTMLS